MDNYSYQITKTAKSDIEQISEYIAKNYYVETAISVVKDIRWKIGQICYSPFIYEERKIFSERFGKIRIANVKNYNIYFAVNETKKIVYIVRVAHCKMNLVQNFIEGMLDD